MLELYIYDAGQGDCLRVRFLGESGRYRNILIDSGPRRFGPAYESMIRKIGSAGERVDAQIITHVDEDHLGGLLYMVCHGNSIPADLVIMNHPQSLKLSNSGNTLLSVSQSNQVVSGLTTQKIVLEKGIKGDLIAIDGAQLHILYPEQRQAESIFDGMASNTPLGIINDRSVPLEHLMEQPLSYRDPSLSNKASIVFVFEYMGKRLLFTGDAWSADLTESVRTYAEKTGEKLPVRFDAVKLPHHGSAGNISEEWPEVIWGERYILCADGRCHPSKQTVAKLLKWYGDIKLVSTCNWWSSGFFSSAEVEQFIHSKRLQLIWEKGDAVLWKF